MFVIGVSGSRKSSFVQAGLLPVLKDYYHEQVKWGVFRHSRSTLAALADAL
jgi:excinuclease UvrABC ATPase subunit